MALTDNLISYWSLDEASGTRADSHGSNDLTDNNTVGSATGKISNAADFDEPSDEYLSSSSGDFSFLDTDYSFSFWFNANSTSGFPGLVSRRSSGLSSDTDYAVYIDSSAKVYVEIGSSGYGNVASTSTISTSTWYHAVFTHDAVNNEIKLYINGTLEDTYSHSGGGNSNTGSLNIGAISSQGLYLDGLMDEIGVWSRVLTGSEVTDLYNGGSGLAYPFSGGPSAPVVTPFRNRLMTPGHIFGGKCLC